MLPTPRTRAPSEAGWRSERGGESAFLRGRRPHSRACPIPVRGTPARPGAPRDQSLKLVIRVVRGTVLVPPPPPSCVRAPCHPQSGKARPQSSTPSAGGCGRPAPRCRSPTTTSTGRRSPENTRAPTARSDGTSPHSPSPATPRSPHPRPARTPARTADAADGPCATPHRPASDPYASDSSGNAPSEPPCPPRARTTYCPARPNWRPPITNPPSGLSERTTR